VRRRRTRAGARRASRAALTSALVLAIGPVTSAHAADGVLGAVQQTAATAVSGVQATAGSATQAAGSATQAAGAVTQAAGGAMEAAANAAAVPAPVTQTVERVAAPVAETVQRVAAPAAQTVQRAAAPATAAAERMVAPVAGSAARAAAPATRSVSDAAAPVSHAVRRTGGIVRTAARDATARRPVLRAVRRVVRPVLTHVNTTVRRTADPPPAGTPSVQPPSPSRVAPAPRAMTPGASAMTHGAPPGGALRDGADAPTADLGGAARNAAKAAATTGPAPVAASFTRTMPGRPPGRAHTALPAQARRAPGTGVARGLVSIVATPGARPSGAGAPSFLPVPGAAGPEPPAAAAAASRRPEVAPRGGRTAPGTPWSAAGAGAGAGAGSAAGGLPLVPILALLSFSLVPPAGVRRIRMVAPGRVPAAPLAPLERPG
jgi:hypothetical protein